MSRFPNILTPPQYSHFGMPERALDVSPLPVQIERSDEAQGPNSTTVEGNFARTWRARTVNIVVPAAVSDGNFTACIKSHDTGQVVDCFMFNPPPDGLVYCLSFQSTLAFALNSALGYWVPSAEFYFCNPAGMPSLPCPPIPLQRHRHRFQIAVWTPNNVSAFTAVVNPVFCNMGGAN